MGICPDPGYSTSSFNPHGVCNGIRHGALQPGSYGKWSHDMVRCITRAEDEAMATLAPEEQEALVSLSRRFTENLIRLIDDPDLKLEEDA